MSTLPPLMANQELPATTGGARWIAIVGNRADGKDGTTYSRSKIIEASTTKEVMPRPKSTRDRVVRPSAAFAPPLSGRQRPWVQTTLDSLACSGGQPLHAADPS